MIRTCLVLVVVTSALLGAWAISRGLIQPNDESGVAVVGRTDQGLLVREDSSDLAKRKKELATENANRMSAIVKVYKGIFALPLVKDAGARADGVFVGENPWEPNKMLAALPNLEKKVAQYLQTKEEEVAQVKWRGFDWKSVIRPRPGEAFFVDRPDVPGGRVDFAWVPARDGVENGFWMNVTKEKEPPPKEVRLRGELALRKSDRSRLEGSLAANGESPQRNRDQGS